MNKKTQFLSLIIALVAADFIGCAAERWTGSVDAVFRYRPSESSTIVHEIRPASLAEEAGLQPGDILLSIDGTNIEKADFETVRAALRGPVGTDAVLKVKRGPKILELTIERRPITENKD